MATNTNLHASLGYELRTSLASIHGALRLLSRDATPPTTASDTQRLLSIAMANTHRLLGLTVAIEGTSQLANVLTIADIDRLRLEAELHQALERQEFVLAYQPIVCTKTEQTIGLEALIRWQHPTRGLIFPSDFIPLAEASGLISTLGQWVVRTACTQLRAWQTAGIAHPDLWVSVNLSPYQLLEPDLLEQCQAILDETQLPAACLHLEMTESAALDSGVNVLAVLQGLRHMGIKIYIDDFGTGYSSLARLHEFP
ncbi:MAG TPA: EAL domain-containing protein, partial [Coleofasciculaceae cyanobacterium]